MGHKSDCAKHSEPAYPAGECDCGYDLLTELREGCDADSHTVKQCNALLMCLCQEAADEIEHLRNECKTAWNSAAAERDLYAKAQNEVTNLSRRLQNGSPVVEGTIQHMAMEIAALKKENEELVMAVSASKAQFEFLHSIQEDGVVPMFGLHEEWQKKMEAVLAKLGADKTGEE